MDGLLARYESDRLAALSADRRRASVRTLRDLQALCDGAELARSDAEAVRRALAAWTAVGASASTVRKQRAMLLAFFAWAHERGHIDGDALLAVRAVRTPVASSHEARPRPYRPGELRKLWANLDERWPKLPDDEAWKWLSRFRDGRSPYSRVRSHAIRCQLDAIIALALHLGLRRREVFALDIVSGHPDNDTVVVWGDDERTIERARAVPVTATVRAALVAWTDCRNAVPPDQHSLWLNLHAEPTCRDPMRRETFNALLRTYVGPGWTLKRLRDTAAAGWVRAGLPLEHLRQLLGLATIEDTLPYARLVGGSLEGRMVELDEHFCELVGPVTITDVAA